eukprot:Nk52_evm84s226 gene=Nk52_evmTU84s226
MMQDDEDLCFETLTFEADNYAASPDACGNAEVEYQHDESASPCKAILAETNCKPKRIRHRRDSYSKRERLRKHMGESPLSGVDLSPGNANSIACETLVIKNLPFAITMNELLEELENLTGSEIECQANHPDCKPGLGNCTYCAEYKNNFFSDYKSKAEQPCSESLSSLEGEEKHILQSVGFYNDAGGVFRGIAFCTYNSVIATSIALDLLHSKVICGRTVRVEFKRYNGMLIGSSNGEAKNGVVQRVEESKSKEVYECLQSFLENESLKEYAFSSNLTPKQRKRVHAIAEQLGLVHKSLGSGLQRQIVVYKCEPLASDMAMIKTRATVSDDNMSARNPPKVGGKPLQTSANPKPRYCIRQPIGPGNQDEGGDRASMPKGFALQRSLKPRWEHIIRLAKESKLNPEAKPFFFPF